MAIAFIAASNGSAASGDVTNVASQNSSDGQGNYLLIVAFADFGVNPTVSDSKGNTWTPLTGASHAANGNFRIQLHYAVTTTKVGSGHTISSSGASFPALVFLSFSGVDQNNPFDSSAGEAGNSAINSVQVGSLTPTNANSVFITGLCSSLTSLGSSIDSSFTEPSGADVANQLEASAAYFYPSSGSKNPTWTDSGFLAAGMAVFQPVSGAVTDNQEWLDRTLGRRRQDETNVSYRKRMERLCPVFQ